MVRRLWRVLGWEVTGLPCVLNHALRLPGGEFPIGEWRQEVWLVYKVRDEGGLMVEQWELLMDQM